MSYEPDTNDIRLRQLKEEIAKIREEQFARAFTTNQGGGANVVGGGLGTASPTTGVASWLPNVIRIVKDTGVIDKMAYDSLVTNKEFAIGEVVTGGTSGATATVGDIDITGSTTGFLFFVQGSITGVFVDGENLDGDINGKGKVELAFGTTQIGRGHLNAGSASIIVDAIESPAEIHFIDNAQNDGQIVLLRANNGFSQGIKVRRAQTSDGNTGNLDLDQTLLLTENELIFMQFQSASNVTPDGGWVPLITGGGGTGSTTVVGGTSFPILYPQELLGNQSLVTVSLNLNQVNGHYKLITMTGDIGLAFNTLPPASNGFKFYVLLTQDAVGGHDLVTLPASVKNGSTLQAQLDTTALAQTLFQFSTADGGVTWHGQIINPSSGGAGDNLGNHTATEDLKMATFDITNLDVLKYADGTQPGADGFIGVGQWGSAVENNTTLKWSIPASTLANTRQFEWRYDGVPAMTLVNTSSGQKNFTLYEAIIQRTTGIGFTHFAPVGQSFIRPFGLELIYQDGFGTGAGGFHGFHVGDGGAGFAQFEIREDVIRANRNLDMITNNIFDVDVVEWASTGGFLAGTNHAIRSIGGGNTGLEYNVPQGKTHRIMFENIGLTNSDVQYEFTQNEVFFNNNQIRDILGITFTNGLFMADILTEFQIIGGRQNPNIPDTQPQPIKFRAQEKTGFDTYVTRDIFTIDAEEFFGGGGMKMHTDLNLQTQNINNVDVMKFAVDGGVIVGTEYAMGADVGDVAFNFNVPLDRDYIFSNNANPIAVLDPTGLQLFANPSSLNPQMGAREFALTGVHTLGTTGMLDGSFRLVGSDVFVHTGGNPINLTSGGTSFIGFNADDDLRMNTFNITGLDVLRFQVDGGVIGFGEYGISADAGNFSMNFSTPSGKGYFFQDNLDGIAFLDENGLQLLGNTGNSDPSFIGKELFLTPHTVGTTGMLDGSFRIAGGDVIVGSGGGFVNLTTLSAGGADNLGNHIATTNLDLSGFFLQDYAGFTSAQGHSSFLNAGSITWDLDSINDAFIWTGNGASFMTLTNSNLNVENRRITNVSDPTSNLDAVNLQTLNTGFVTTNTNQLTGLSGDKVWSGDHSFHGNSMIIGDSSSDTVAFNSLVLSSIEPQSTGLNLGSSARRWDIFGQGLNLSNNVGVGTISLSSSESSTTALMTASAIQSAILAGGGGGVQPSDNVIWTGTHNFNGNSMIIGNSPSDSVAFNSLVLSSILPQSSGLNLGSSSNRWDIFGFGLNLQLGVGINNISTSSTQNNNTSIMTSQAIQTAILAGGGGSGDIIQQGNSSVQIVDLGSGQIVFTIDGANVGSWFSSNFIVSTPATFTNTVNFNGNVNIGNSSTDTVDFNADVGSHFLPNSTSGAFDLGNSSKQWGELWVTGTANIDDLRLNSGSTVDEISNSLASFGSDQLMTANAIQNAILAFGGGSGPTLSGTNAWTGTNTWSSSGSRFLSTLRIDGDLNHDGSRIGFRGATPQTGSPISTISLASSNATIASKLNQTILTLRTMGIFI